MEYELKKNERNIKSVNVFTSNGVLREANIIRFTNFNGYDFFGNGGNVDYAICGTEKYQTEDGEIYVSVPYFNFSASVPNEIISKWGDDDNVIFDYIIKEKNLI